MKKLKNLIMLLNFSCTVLVFGASKKSQTNLSPGIGLFKIFKQLSFRNPSLPKLMQEYGSKNPELLLEAGKTYNDKAENVAVTVKSIQSVKKIKRLLGGEIKDFFKAISSSVLRKSSNVLKRLLLRRKKKKPRFGGIVLIHGTSSNSWQWKLVQHYLEEHNFDGKLGRILVVDYNSHQDVLQSCSDVWNQIREYFTEDEKVILIGHSQGGLIARALADHEECEGLNQEDGPELAAVFSLNAPLKGALTLNYLNHISSISSPKGSSRDMTVGSKFIQKLRESIKKKKLARTKVFEVAGKLDTMVDPSLSLTGAANVTGTKILEGGHFVAAFDYNLWSSYIIPKAKVLLSKKTPEENIQAVVRGFLSRKK